MPTRGDVEEFILNQLSLICKEPEKSFSADTQLVGENRSIKSIQLVELLLKMEEYVEEKFNSEAIKKFGSKDAGASLANVLGAALKNKKK